MCCFNSRTPRGVRHPQDRLLPLLQEFQFTHPAWGATLIRARQAAVHEAVSIHAPRVGCDQPLQRLIALVQSFNSRTPRGVRLHNSAIYRCASGSFNSRTPRGVRPKVTEGRIAYVTVSIHAPRVGCDKPPSERPSYNPSFNSRTPRGVRLEERVLPGCKYSFNSRTPRGVRLRVGRFFEAENFTGFNSRTPRGVRQTKAA